jgi:mono/diheme cytochrome c family protein
MGAVALLMALAVSATGCAQTPEQTREAIGLLHARCAVCHSTDLISQQRLNRDRWTATLHKMRSWGASLSDPEQAVLLEYLEARFHSTAPPGLSLEPEGSATSAAAPVPADYPRGEATRGQGLFLSNCLPCHGPNAAGGVGPRLSANPILSQNGAFWQTVLYGRGAMPAWKNTLTPQQIADIQAWLKTQR